MPILVGRNSDDTRAAKLAPEILSRYVGTYLFNGKELGIPGINIVPAQVTLEDGALHLGLGGGARQTMIALSETTFTGMGGYIEFGMDAKGDYMIVRVAEGDFRGNKGAAPAPPQQRIAVLDRSGKVVTTLGEAGAYSQAAISPDGTRVAAIRTDSKTGEKNARGCLRSIAARAQR